MGRDPLGMQAASVRLYTQLVPGITNVTNRIRYYSFYCWVIWQFENIEHSENEEKWKIFIRRAEAIYALSCVAYCEENSGGMAGTDWAREHSGNLTKTEFDFTQWTDSPGQLGQYLKATRGNFGQFYISSMIEIGMLKSTGSRIPLLTEEFGISVAQAFEKNCSKASKYIRQAIISGEITAEHAKKIASEANPAALADEAEREYLRDFLLGKRSSDPTSSKRKASLWNCLNALKFTEDWNIDKIRTLFYTQQFNRSELATKFPENLNNWRAYQANELCHISLELILNDLSHAISQHPGGIEPETAIKKLMSRAFSQVAQASETFETYAGEMITSRSLEHDCEDGARIVKVLSNPLKRPSRGDVLAALNLLSVLFGRWKETKELFDALDPKKNFNRSLAALIEFAKRLEQLPAIEALSQIIQKFVVGNHLHIAGRKLAESGTFTFRFLSEDGLLKDVRLTNYDFTTPRIFNLLWFAEDVGLIADEKLTKAGIEFLNDN